jgi:hypothetical protein
VLWADGVPCGGFIQRAGSVQLHRLLRSCIERKQVEDQAQSL